MEPEKDIYRICIVTNTHVSIPIAMTAHPEQREFMRNWLDRLVTLRLVARWARSPSNAPSLAHAPMSERP